MMYLIDQNFNLHSRKIPGLTEGMKVFQHPGITYVDSSFSCDTFNIIHIHEGEKVLAENISDVINYYRARELTYCLWICRQNLTEMVKTSIGMLGLKQQNSEPGMLLRIDNYQPVQQVNYKNIVSGNDIKLIHDYAEVVAENWVPADLNVPAYYNKAASAILNNTNTIQFCIYYQDDKPVSVIELFASDDKTVGLYGLATLKSYRGKGIGTSLLTFALNQCKELGYSNVILQASEDGLGMYKKLGFETYTEYYEFA